MEPSGITSYYDFIVELMKCSYYDFIVDFIHNITYDIVCDIVHQHSMIYHILLYDIMLWYDSVWYHMDDMYDFLYWQAGVNISKDMFTPAGQ